MNDTSQISDIPAKRELKQQLGTISALDRAFPPVWVLGGLIGFVCLLLLAMGWKIMAFETERAEFQVIIAEERKNLALGNQELENQRHQLAEQKERYHEILAQLPQLEEQHISLTQKIAVLRSEKEALEIRLKTASEQMGAIQDQTKIAQRDMKDAIERRDSAQNEYKALSAQSGRLQPQVEALSQKEQALGGHIATLQEQENKLEQNRVKLRQTCDELEIKVSSLNNQISGKTQALEALRQDGQAYASLTQGFQKILAEFQTLNSDARQTVHGLKSDAEAFTALADIRKKAEQASVGLVAEVENAHNTVGSLEQERKLLQTATTTLNQRLDEFFKQTARFQGFAETTGQGASKLDSTTSKLENEYQILQKFNQNLAAQVDQSCKSLKQVIADTKSLIEITPELKSATAATVQLGDKAGRLDALLSELSTLKQQLDSLARKIEHAADTPLDIDPTSGQRQHPASKNTSQSQ